MRRAVLLVCTLILIFSFLNLNSMAADNELEDFTLAAENRYSQLYINENTTEIAVLRKNTGQIWYSSPPDLEERETQRRGSARDAMKAPLEITYIGRQGNINTLDVFNESVDYDQFEIKEIDNGVRVEYTLLEEWQDDDYLPVMMDKEKFEEEIIDNIADEQIQELFLENYALLTLTEQDEYPYTFDILGGVNLRNLLGNYKLESLTEATDSFLATIRRERDRHEELIGLLIETIFENRTDIDSWIGVSADDLDIFRENPTYVLLEGTFPRWDREDMIDTLKEIGYTPEDKWEDHLTYNLQLPTPTPTFNISIEYTLDQKDLLAFIPTADIQYPVNVETEEGELINLPVYTVRVLRYFGAANRDEQGYIFVPDGSGALINLNRETHSVNPYLGRVYGRDKSIMPRREKIFSDEKIRMPVFGINRTTRGMLSIIENGDSLAEIRASVAGQASSFNTVHSEFFIRRKGEIRITGEGIIDENIFSFLTNYQKEKYKEDIQIRYKFLDEQNSSYIDMALTYQDYLVEKYGLEKINPDENIPFNLELYGSLEKDALVLGIPREKVYPTTTYNQLLTILEELQQRDINNINLKYTGWSEGGIKHYYPQQVALENNLGSREDFQQLLEFVDKNEINFYPDLAFLNIYQSKLFDGFRKSRDSARFLNWEPAQIYDYDLVTFQKKDDSARYVLSPDRYSSIVQKYINDFNNYNIGGLSLRYMGDQVNADYREENTIDRQQAQQAIIEQLETMHSDINLMLNGGNIFVLPYAEALLNTPAKSSNYDLVDRDIPFYQIVLQGYVNFSNAPWNRRGDKIQENILKALETGQLPYYHGIYEDSSAVKDTKYEHLFSAGYRDWIQEAGRVYEELNPIMAELQAQRIIDHFQIEEGVYQTTYEEGTTVIVNYNEYSVEVEGYNIGARDYVISKNQGEE